MRNSYRQADGEALHDDAYGTWDVLSQAAAKAIEQGVRDSLPSSRWHSPGIAATILSESTHDPDLSAPLEKPMPIYPESFLKFSDTW